MWIILEKIVISLLMWIDHSGSPKKPYTFLILCLSFCLKYLSPRKFCWSFGAHLKCHILSRFFLTFPGVFAPYLGFPWHLVNICNMALTKSRSPPGVFAPYLEFPWHLVNIFNMTLTKSQSSFQHLDVLSLLTNADSDNFNNQHV